MVFYLFIVLMVTVCRALVDEVNYAIGKVDPKKTIQVGSFRVDSKGNQGTYEVRIQEMKLRTFTYVQPYCPSQI